MDKSDKMDKPMKQITSLKSAQDLRQYLESHRNLNLSLMIDKNGATLLHYAAFKNDFVKLKIYFQHYKAYCQLTHGNKMYEVGFQSKVKAWINTPNNQGLTPLHFATLHGNIQIIKLLEQLGANMQFKSNQGQNVLFMAVQNNQIKTLIYFLEESNNKLDINEKNNIGDNLLHKSARNGCIGITAYLLTKQININEQNQEGFTPLMQAVLGNNKQIVKNMLLKGVDRHVKNKEDKEAIQLANQQNKSELANILNDQFGFGQKIKIACNTKIVYRVEKQSYSYAIYFILLYHIVFLPTCILTQFVHLQDDNLKYYPIIGQAIYYLITLVIFILLLRKPTKKKPLQSLINAELPFCAQCRNEKKKQYHCFICENCIYRYDHHCPWINNCVGVKNIGKFYAFLWLIQLGTLYVVFCHLCMIGLNKNFVKYRQFTTIEPEEKYISVICLIISSFFGISIFLIILQQTNNLLTNTTQYQRSKKLRKKGKAKASQITSQDPKETLLSADGNSQSQSFISNVSADQQQNPNCFGNCSNMLCKDK